MATVEQIGNATLYLGDCRDVLASLQDPVGTVITDPPYEEEAHAANRILGSGRDRAMRERALDFAPMTDGLRQEVSGQFARLCDGWVLCFSQAEAIAAWRAAMVSAGMSWRRAMVWVKPDSSPQLSGDRPAQGYESIAAAWNGEGRSRWNGGGRRGVFTFGKHDAGYGHGGQKNEHPTQKPVRLMVELCGLFAAAQRPVLDAFMGSGSTGVACIELGLPFIGIESNPGHFKTACRRIEDAQRQATLFAAHMEADHA